MTFSNQLLIRVLESSRGKSLSVDDILLRAALDPEEKVAVRRALKRLVKDKKVELAGKRYRIPPPPPEPETPALGAGGKKVRGAAGAVAPAFLRGDKARGERSRGERRGAKGAEERRELEFGVARASLPPRPRDPMKEIVGTLIQTRQGYGFIRSLHGGLDAFVPQWLMRDTLDGDLVRAGLSVGRDGRIAATDLEIIEHRRQYAVGTYRARQRKAWVEPREEKLGLVYVAPTKLAKDGEVVRVQITAISGGQLQGRVDARLGLPGDPDVEVLSVAYGEGFSDVFPPNVLAAADSLPTEVRAQDRKDRRDLTALPLVTIDGEDARDFDDAVFVEKSAKGYRLLVAIADVSAYVGEDGAIDTEALARGTSVYFPGHVLPMLPTALSNGICSLMPDVERLCVAVDMRFDRKGQPLGCELYPALMKSHARCTYTQVAALLEGQPVPELKKLKGITPMLKTAAELASLLTTVRMERGAIDFDLPEGFVKLDEEHRVQDIVRRERSPAHRLIEEFMIAANESVARFFEAHSLPTVFRVHGEPDAGKLESFAALAQVYGFPLSLSEQGMIDPGQLNEFLHQLDGHPQQRALNHLLLRAMMQAVYSAENQGHFGLASGSYLHFTSPIRRYPDLIVHRLLKRFWAAGGSTRLVEGLAPPVPEGGRASGKRGAKPGRGSEVLAQRGKLEKERGREPAASKRAKVPAKRGISCSALEAEEERLDSLAVHCSERERAAMSASREIAAYYAAVLMTQHVGEEFSGTIASIADFGFFVELDSPFVEGLIRAESLGVDWRYDLELHRMVYPGLGKVFAVGNEVKVVVTAANPVTRRVDFGLIEGGSPAEWLGKAEPEKKETRAERGERAKQRDQLKQGDRSKQKDQSKEKDQSKQGDRSKQKDQGKQKVQAKQGDRRTKPEGGGKKGSREKKQGAKKKA